MKKIAPSLLIDKQVPGFVSENHETFITFLRLYYEFLQVENQVDFFNQEALSYIDVDETLDDFINYLFDELKSLPVETAVDKRLFGKHVYDLYRAKGSPNSFSILFRALFGKSVEIYHPSEYILRASDGRWTQETSVLINVTEGDPFNFVGNFVQGTFSGEIVTFFVDRVKFLTGTTYEIFFDRKYKDLITFPGTIVFGPNSGSVIQGISTVTVSTNTTGFYVGQIIVVTGGTGTGLKLRIRKLTATGNISTVEIVDFGVGYTAGFQYTQGGATFDFSIGPVAKYPGYFATANGFLSDVMVLQDNFYYQMYSYVLILDEQIHAYKNIVSKLLHPAGLKMFGEFSIQNTFDVSNQSIESFLSQNSLVDYISMIDELTYTLNKTINDVMTISDSGTLSMTFASDYSDYPPGDVDSYFAEAGLDQYAAGSATETRTW